MVAGGTQAYEGLNIFNDGTYKATLYLEPVAKSGHLRARADRSVPHVNLPGPLSNLHPIGVIQESERENAHRVGIPLTR